MLGRDFDLEVLEPRYEQCFASLQKTLETLHQRNMVIQGSEIEVGRNIGEGAFGTIFKGKYNGRKCAIKSLINGADQQSDEYKRHISEISILSDLTGHPNIVEFYGACFKDLHSPIIVEELIEGTNLEEYLRPKRLGFNLGSGKVNEDTSAAHMKQI